MCVLYNMTISQNLAVLVVHSMFDLPLKQIWCYWAPANLGNKLSCSPDMADFKGNS